MRADDHSLVVLGDPLDGRQQVGEALAHAGSGLNQQMALPVERLGDGLGHGQLLRTNLVARQAAGNQAFRIEQLWRVHGHCSPAILVLQTHSRFKRARGYRRGSL